MAALPLTVAAFQQHIRDKYEAVDRARGSAKTFVWFIEEVGELATAINGDAKDSDVRANLEEEFADVFAWLCTLANINGIEMADVIAKKYFGDAPPSGTK
ncbi:MAG: MazG nucleotide pyrophosphohydrolase domain protein [Phycisphaerales bacterium]|nr:MazG nucleotide pyrophosphohydrolase domain protein [Phycisphaerales bacterium]